MCHLIIPVYQLDLLEVEKKNFSYILWTWVFSNSCFVDLTSHLGLLKVCRQAFIITCEGGGYLLWWHVCLLWFPWLFSHCFCYLNQKSLCRSIHCFDLLCMYVWWKQTCRVSSINPKCQMWTWVWTNWSCFVSKFVSTGYSSLSSKRKRFLFFYSWCTRNRRKTWYRR